MRADLRWLLAVALLLAAGVVFALVMGGSPAVESGPGALWIPRQFDLYAQIGLFFLGALGIRALLPGEEED